MKEVNSITVAAIIFDERRFGYMNANVAIVSYRKLKPLDSWCAGPPPAEQYHQALFGNDLRECGFWTTERHRGNSGHAFPLFRCKAVVRA